MACWFEGAHKQRLHARGVLVRLQELQPWEETLDESAAALLGRIAYKRNLTPPDRDTQCGRKKYHAGNHD